LASALSRALGDAVQAGAGRIETLELGHRYGHHSPRLRFRDAPTVIVGPGRGVDVSTDNRNAVPAIGPWSSSDWLVSNCAR